MLDSHQQTQGCSRSIDFPKRNLKLKEPRSKSMTQRVSKVKESFCKFFRRRLELLVGQTLPSKKVKSAEYVFCQTSLALAIKGDVVLPNAEATFYREFRPQSFFLNQPFVDKTIGLQTLAIIPVRDRTVIQKAFRDVFLKDRRVIHPSDFPNFRHHPIKQNSFMVTSFRDKLFKDAILKNRKMRGERSVLTDNSFEGQSLTPEEIFEGQASTYRSQAPFEEQLLTMGTPFKNLFRRQLSSAEQATFQKQAAFVESPSISNSIEFYRDDYINPIDSYER
ncbi:Uncharacterized protein DBV15_11125 [Temnothorax longispinosus]|uniref:Uncharacterized protein n=1 Tax=Temnothorax longispinosus TaxID=300112 RepID=A0A4S2KGB4_9HYME|nr:Uncharacterized protein DBV15_11125 [Temnothorax longispinosus]